MKKLLFREEQRFRAWDVYLWLSFFTVALLWRAVNGILTAEAGNPSAPVATYLLFALITGGLLAYYYSVRLVTKIDTRGIQVKYFPWHVKKRRLRWDDIADCHVVDVPARTALNGWCVDYSGDRRFSVSGRRRGLELKLKTGDFIFIGTRQPYRLKEIIGKMKERNQD